MLIHERNDLTNFFEVHGGLVRLPERLRGQTICVKRNPQTANPLGLSKALMQNPRVSDTPSPPNPLPRAPEPNELLPTDYFRRFERADIFPDSAPLEVDLGSGDGSFLLAMAKQFPDRRFLGVERLLGRVRKLCRRSHRDGLTNLKVLRLESIYTVEWLLPPKSISRIHLLFPDPWPKARHHKRRVVQAPFLNAVTKALVPGGEFLFRTDHEEYAEWAREELEAFDALQLIDWLPDDEFYAETDFQRQWAAEGRSKVYSLRAITAA